MISIRVKLFSKKNKNNGEKLILNSFEQLGTDEMRSKILDDTTSKSKDNKFKELINRYKTDPDFKKKVKTGGYITLGTALTAGAIIGGTKLIKNKKKKRDNDNEKMKNSILLDNNKENK